MASLHPATPAFTALLNAYHRWQDFEQISAQGTPSSSNVPRPDGHVRLSVPTSPALAFIIACPCIDVQKLPEDERNCHICTDPFHRLDDREKNRKLKVAQKLPCGHYLCSYCIFKWLNPFEESNNNTCPFDRRVLFPKFAHFWSTEGIQGRIDLVDWFSQEKGQHPAGVRRDQTRALKTLLVERRLGEAVEELEIDRFKADILTQSKVGARDIADCLELLQFQHRLTTVRTITHSMEGRMHTPPLRARLQHMTEALARDQANARQETRDAVDELEGGGIAEGSERML